jgi:phosphate transport system substrate-binding protein
MKRMIRCSLLVAVLLTAGCAPSMHETASDGRMLRIKGSDSMLLLVQRLAEQYMLRYPGAVVDVEGGGSAAGITALIDGSVDLCATSRPLSPEEVSALAKRHRSLGVSILCAKDALNVIVHPSNPVTDLPLKRAVEIFTGAVTRWEDGRPIVVYNREPNSGTYLYFEEHVLLGDEYTDDALTVPGARAMTAAVAGDPAGIGYGTSAYSEGVKPVAIDGVYPTEEHVRNGRYPICRYLYFYSVHQPAGEIKRFLDWAVSEEGQGVARANGYIPLYGPMR